MQHRLNRIRDWHRQKGILDVLWSHCWAVTPRAGPRAVPRWLLGVSRVDPSPQNIPRWLPGLFTLPRSSSRSSGGTSWLPGCAHCLCCWHWAPLGAPWLSFYPTYRYLYTLTPPEPALLRLSQPRSLSHPPQETCASPLIILMALCWTLFSVSVLPMYWGY